MRSFLVYILLVISLFLGCTPKQAPATKSGIRASQFEQTIDGKPNKLFTIKNVNGLELSVTNLGAKVVSFLVPDKAGNFDDIVLGFDNIKDYSNPKSTYLGAAIGRYANRIANARFSLEGSEYQLAKNNGNNSIHGGSKGYNAVMWDINKLNPTTLECFYISEDGEMGYPGTLRITMMYELTNNNEFKISYSATTDKATPVNLTHHSFFNLMGEGYPTINDHLVTINADYYTSTDAAMIPTGEIAPLSGTPLDFKNPTRIGDNIDIDFLPLINAKGYDHNYIINKTKTDDIVLAASVYAPASGRFMEVFTDQPGIQFYTGNFLDGSMTGKKGKAYLSRSAFCLETQHYADSPNKPSFPNTILQPGENYKHVCIYKFSTK